MRIPSRYPHHNSLTYAHNQPEITSTKTASGKRVIPLDERLEALLKPVITSDYVLGGNGL